MTDCFVISSLQQLHGLWEVFFLKGIRNPDRDTIKKFVLMGNILDNRKVYDTEDDRLEGNVFVNKTIYEDIIKYVIGHKDDFICLFGSIESGLRELDNASDVEKQYIELCQYLYLDEETRSIFVNGSLTEAVFKSLRNCLVDKLNNHDLYNIDKVVTYHNKNKYLAFTDIMETDRNILTSKHWYRGEALFPSDIDLMRICNGKYKNIFYGNSDFRPIGPIPIYLFNSKNETNTILTNVNLESARFIGVRSTTSTPSNFLITLSSDYKPFKEEALKNIKGSEIFYEDSNDDLPQAVGVYDATTKKLYVAYRGYLNDKKEVSTDSIYVSFTDFKPEFVLDIDEHPLPDDFMKEVDDVCVENFMKQFHVFIDEIKKPEVLSALTEKFFSNDEA